MPWLDRRAFLAAMLLSPVARATAQPVIPKTRLTIFDAPPSTHRLDRSFVTGNGGHRYQIFTATPVATPPPEGLPVLYMLDGNAVFDLLTAALLNSIPRLAIVGIGYDTDLRFAVNERSRDYTPPPPGHDAPVADPERPGRLIGGAASFLDFVKGPLRREVERETGVNAGRRFIWGHSYGGLFTLYALFTQPSAFDGYAAISPSIWRSGPAMNTLLKQAIWPKNVNIPVFVALGDRERRSDGSAPAPVGPAPQTMSMIERLKREAALNIEAHVMKGLGHGATLEASFEPVLAWIDRQTHG